MDILDRPEYADGRAWAEAHHTQVAELYSGRELDTAELRNHLFKEAARKYPDQRDSMDNAIKQDLFVAGALRALVDRLPNDQGGVRAMADAAMDMGSIIGADMAKGEAIDQLRKRPSSWWSRRFGGATPDDVVRAMAKKWERDDLATRRGVSPTRWEVLIDQTGSREMDVLENLHEISLQMDGKYHYYVVSGGGHSFDIMAKDVIEEGRLVQGAGEIVG